MLGCGLHRAARTTAAVLVTAALVSLTGRAASAQELSRLSRLSRPYRDFVYVTASPRSQTDVDRIWDVAENVIAPHDPSLASHALVISRQTLSALIAQGVPLRVEPIDVQRMVDQSYRTKQSPYLQLGKLNIFSGFFNNVQPLDAIYQKMDELAQASNGRARVMVIGKSVQGRDVKAMRISAAPEQGDRASILVNGTHHAREWITPMVSMGLIEGLLAQAGENPDVDKIVNNLDTYVIPVLNPDGYAITHAGTRLQRKNLRPDCNVDLNRNWDIAWGTNVSRNCSGETFPGSGAFSEPETQAMKSLVESIKKLRFYIDYHSNARQIMIPYAYTRTLAPDVARTRARGELYAQKLATVNGTDLPVRDGYDLGRGQGGGAIDYLRAKYAETICVELRGGQGAGGFDVPADGVIPSVEENWVGFVAVAAQLADENPAGGAVSADAGARDAGAVDAPATVDAPAVAPADTGSMGAGGGAGIGGVTGTGGDVVDVSGGGGTGGLGPPIAPPSRGQPTGRPPGADAPAIVEGGCACQSSRSATAEWPFLLFAASAFWMCRRRAR